MKRIVICCDGTWNSNDGTGGQAGRETNVAKLYEFVIPSDRQGTAQEKFYHVGVGVRRWERLRGGGLGWGLSRNVKDAYANCVETFEPSDELFLFGFSRGAYTARSLAGLIRNSGILKREHRDQLDAAYELYRDRSERTGPRQAAAVEFRKKFSHETGITFIGVWDTVGSLGIPRIGMGLVNALFRWRWSFHDVDLSTTVGCACQALAIDELRGPFGPTLWRQQPGAQRQTLEQVWFPGVHSDVGGGYTETGLSDVALLWMLDRAAARGLAFDWELIKQRVKPDPLGPIHDSLSTFYKILNRAARLVRIERGRTRSRPTGEQTDGHESVAASAIVRNSQMQLYRPANVHRYLNAGGKTVSVRLSVD